MAKKLTEDQLNWILSIDSTEAQQGIRKLANANKELEKANKERRAEMIRLESQGKKETQAYKNLSFVIEENSGKLRSNRQMIKALEDKIGTAGLTMSQLKKKAQDLQRQLDNTSQATNPSEWNALNNNLSKVRSKMDELKNSGKQTKDALSNLIPKISIGSIIGNIATTGFQKITETIQAFKEFVKEGINMAGMAQGVERAFNRISNPDTLSELQKATKGTVNNLELMKAAVQANNFNIPLSEIGTLLRFAQQRAQETGQSVDYLTQSIVTGIGRKSPLILDNLGISAVKLNEEFSKTGNFAKAVGNIVREELAKSGESIDTTADKAQRRSTLLQNIQLSIGQRMTGMAESTGSAWISFLGVIDKWVKIPTVEKLRDEQREVNILANSIKAAEGHAETRTLLIIEMNRQYPSFLSNLDTERLTNEQISKRLQDVNEEYNKRIRIQVMNDKILAPLQKKRNELIEDEMSGITSLNRIADLYGNKMSRSFVDAIRSGDVLKMSTKDIEFELNKMRSYGAAGGLTLGMEKTINRLKEIPSELGKVEKQIETTTDRISSFGKKDDPDPVKEEISKIKELEDKRKGLIETMSESTEEKIKEKNIAIQAIDEKIAKLKSLGIEKENPKTPNSNPYQEELESVDKMISDKRLKISNDFVEGRILKDEYNHQIEALELESLNRKLAIYKVGSEERKKIEQQVLDYRIKQTLNEEKEKIAAIKNNRDNQLQIEQENFTQQQSVLEKHLSSEKITQDQYNMLMLNLEDESASSRLQIQQNYAKDITSLEIQTGSLKAEAIQEANKVVLDADLQATQSRAKQQKALQNLVKDFKGEFKLTTLDEDIDLQLKVLEASYQARKEMANKANLDTLELDRAYERAKTNILQSGEDRRNQIRSQYGLLSLQEQFEIEQEQLTKQREEGLLSEEEYQKALTNIKINTLKTYYDYYKQLVTGALSALEESELANIDAKYDVEIQRAQGNADEVARLEKEKEQKKLEVQKKYAGANFAIKVSQIIADTAVSIMRAYAELGPIGGTVAAAFLAVIGAAQIATANAERKKVMNMTANGSTSGSKSGSGTGQYVATGKESGGYINVSRAQDNKEFNALLNPDQRGYVNRPTVIVGEGPDSNEWVASNDALKNPTVAPIIHLLNQSQEAGTIRTIDMNQIMRRQMAGFSSGGFISSSANSSPSIQAQARSSGDGKLTPILSDLTNVLSTLQAKGLKAYVVYSDIQDAGKLLNKAKSIGGKQ